MQFPVLGRGFGRVRGLEWNILGPTVMIPPPSVFGMHNNY